MADSRPRRAAVLTVISALALAGCGDTVSGTPATTRDAIRASAERLPAHYSYVLTSSCGERALLGTFRITVRDRDVVTAAESLDPDSNSTVRQSDFPTAGGLLDEALDAGANAVLEFEAAAAGLPVRLSIDPEPNATDDEECYRFAEISPTSRG